MDCGKFVAVESVKLLQNDASNRFPAAFDLVGVCTAAAFGFTAYGDTGVVVCEMLPDLSPVSPHASFVCSIWGEGEAIAFLGDGLDGRTSGKFCEDTLPFGRCLGATLVPSSVWICCFEAFKAFCADARFSSLSNVGHGSVSSTAASDFYKIVIKY